MVRREKERSGISVGRMDNLRSLLGIRRTDRIGNARIREMSCVKKGANERIDECVPCGLAILKNLQ